MEDDNADATLPPCPSKSVITASPAPLNGTLGTAWFTCRPFELKLTTETKDDRPEVSGMPGGGCGKRKKKGGEICLNYEYV